MRPLIRWVWTPFKNTVIERLPFAFRNEKIRSNTSVRFIRVKPIRIGTMMPPVYTVPRRLSGTVRNSPFLKFAGFPSTNSKITNATTAVTTMTVERKMDCFIAALLVW